MESKKEKVKKEPMICKVNQGANKKNRPAFCRTALTNIL
jgi:hypothetical protein